MPQGPEPAAKRAGLPRSEDAPPGRAAEFRGRAMRRRELLATLAGTVAASVAAEAQQVRKVWWISCLIVGICVVGSNAFAATYYISPSGSDSNPGSLSLPFRTIQRCANIAAAGDTCLIRTGTYRETVRPSQSGSASAPITFQAYPGDTVTLTGADPVGGWTVYSGSIYKAPLSGTVNQVFVDGQMMTWARWPNDTGPDLLHPTLATSDSGTGIDRTAGTETVVDAALGNFPAGYWDDAVIWISAIGYSPRK